MSLLLALPFLAAAPISGIPDIVVIGKRLEGISVSVGQDAEGSWHCSLDKSSGVPSLDSRLCKAVTTCVRKGARTDEAIHGCVTKSKRRLLKRFEREYRKQR